MIKTKQNIRVLSNFSFFGLKIGLQSSAYQASIDNNAFTFFAKKLSASTYLFILRSSDDPDPPDPLELLPVLAAFLRRILCILEANWVVCSVSE